MNLPLTLGLTAAVLHGAANLLYARQTRDGTSQPNIASWAVWAFLAILNALSYWAMCGSILLAAQYLTGAVACLIVFSYALCTGKLSKPGWVEVTVLVLGTAAVLIWWINWSAADADWLVFLAFLISFVPTYVGVIRDPHKEAPLAWLVWTAACALTVANVIEQGKGGTQAIVVPAEMLVLHVGVACLAQRK